VLAVLLAGTAGCAESTARQSLTRDEQGRCDPGAVYTPDLSSLACHELPAWFAEAKLGVLVHYGPYSVPAWAPRQADPFHEVVARDGWGAWFGRNPYAEWYANSIRIADSPSQIHHRETFGEGFSYERFAPRFAEQAARASMADWAQLFARAGARYAVLTTKHHDGYLLWPGAHVGPGGSGHVSPRDLVGEFAAAMRARQLRVGLYYSGGLDWSFDGRVIDSLESLLAAMPRGATYAAYATAQVRELIDRYRPDLLWNDLGFPDPERALEVIAHLYNTVPGAAVNDRFGFPAGPHRDFTTPEYSTEPPPGGEKWEATRGLGQSFGYNRAEVEADVLSLDALVDLLADVVSKNGNLLIGIGPMADGTIPELQVQRLLGLGQWLARHGAAIYGTRPAAQAAGRTRAGGRLRYTRDGAVLYAILLDPGPDRQLVIESLPLAPGAEISRLSTGEPLSWRAEGQDVVVSLSAAADDPLAEVLRIAPAP
jgi:alpha-L-fucosidase